MVNSYCVTCKNTTATKDPKVSLAKNGRKMMKGVCGVCGRKKCQFMKSTGTSSVKTKKKGGNIFSNIFG